MVVVAAATRPTPATAPAPAAGSGGGGGASSGGTTNGGTGSQGYSGGGNGSFLGAPYPGGGGGGGAGANATSSSVAGIGGAGYVSSLSGSSQTYAGGGGGATWASGTPGSGGSGGGGNGVDGGNGQNAAANTGGGGGGANNTFIGGSGGSGIVIIRYAGAPCATGGTITSAGGYTVHTFTSSGTFQLLDASQTLPFFAGFESVDGYATGSLNNQEGWVVVQGAASITTADHTEGVRSLVLEAGTTAAKATMGFAASATPDVTFLDFTAKPVATVTGADSSSVQTEAAKVGFQIVNGLGEIYVFDGGGNNQWVATGWRFPLNGSNQATDWVRLTLRLDYTARTWDLFINGQLAEIDLAFSNSSETFFRQLALMGATSAPAYVDAILISDTNPLFTDADKDGMDDAWEIAHGLNPAVNDRNGNLDGDAFTNIQERLLGTKPNNADVTKPSVPTGLTANSVTDTSLGLSWTASTDTGAGTPGVAGYIVYRNGARRNTTLLTATSYTDTGLSAATNFAYTIRAVDLAGNLSDASSALNVTTSDTQAPTVPAGLATGSLAPTSFTLTWTASTDNVGVTAYEVFKDSVSQGTTTSPGMSLTGLIQATSYAMTVQARDAAGNWSAQSTALNVTTSTGGVAVQYTYDASGRVTQAKYVGVATQNYTHTAASNLSQVSTTQP